MNEDRTMETQSLHLTGVSNGRTLAGYRTQDGRTIRPHKLLRAGMLAKATPQDVDLLVNQEHLGMIIDLRTETEVRAGKDPLMEGVSWHNIHVSDEQLDIDYLKKEYGSVIHYIEEVLHVSGIDWNADLSPWKAKALFRGSPDFAGKADTLICELMKHPTVTDQRWKHRIIAGYSLAGLFVLYACTKTDLFDGCVSCSGSLWYPGFVQYLKESRVYARVIYLSFGTKEKNSRNPVLSKIEERTEQVVHFLKQDHICTLEMNPGSHFHDPDGRLQKGITWMMAHLPGR